MSSRFESPSFEQQWQDWHEAHQAVVSDPHGFLAVTHLHWLDDEPRAYAGAPGMWSVAEDQVAVSLGTHEHLSQHGARLDRGAGTRHVFEPIAERDSIFLDSGADAVEVAKRGGRHLLRPRRHDHPLVVGYRGTPAYAPTRRFVLEGRYVPFEGSHPVTVGSAAEGLEHVYDAPGTVRFAFDGVEHELTAFSGRDPRVLQILFRDETSGRSTYAANRSLTVTVEDDGAVVVDFNRAVNLPCAYTDLATCPLPPAGNRLSFAVEAGEKIPYERTGAA